MTRTATRNRISNYDPSLTLIGFKSERGFVFGAAEDGSNCYDGPVPVEAAEKLLGWIPLEAPVQGTVTTLTEDGVTTETITDPTRKSIIHPESHKFLGVFKNSYRVHGYKQWLISHVDLLLHGGLQISRVGLLDDGAKAYIQVELPGTRKAGSADYRTYFTAATSLDGSLSTTYSTGTELIICGNQFPGFFGREEGRKIKKIRHSSNSLGRAGEISEVLGLVVETDEAFQREYERLSAVPVSDLTFGDFLNEIAPLTDSKGKTKEGRSLTLAQNHQAALQHLWTSDPMVTPFHGTAFGAFQAENTYRHHLSTVRNVSREERVLSAAVTGKGATEDRKVLASLETVLARTR